MKFGRFFIDRPRFAAVLSILIVLAGVLAYFELPVTQYPEIAPPTVEVTAIYPGADPETVADTVAAPIEQAINGVEGMLYMTSSSTVDGAMSLSVAFELGTDLDTAQILVQNRVASAEARLPEEVRRLGVTVLKSSPDIMMVIHILSPDDTFDELYISNYALLRVTDVLQRIDGVGNVVVFGAREYGMRIWLDPERLAARSLTAGDVVGALRAQNVQVSAGSLGQPPMPQGNAFQLKIGTQGRFQTAEEFEQVIVKSGADGRLTRVGDVARVELGAQDYLRNSYLNGEQAAGVAIFQRPGSNALETAGELRSTIAELSQSFPEGLAYEIAYDPTVFVEESVEAVYHTIFEAVLLVILVIILFLQSWRAALIPIAAIPVSLVGTFAVMAVAGFSLNNLSLFGLVLAIGIVVDDAIVVVENIERNLDLGLSPKEAARTTMDEVGTALVSIALVLSAVFVPTAFLGGISGQFFRQFGVTIAVATLISALNSLTLSPALGAIILKPKDAPRSGFGKVWWTVLGPIFRAFDRVFERATDLYARSIGRIVRRPLVSMAVFLVLLGLGTWVFLAVPGGFIPQQDQGYLIVAASLPPGASLQRTDAVVLEATELLRETDGISDVVGIVGLSGATFSSASNAAALFVILDPFEEREGEELASANLVDAVQGVLGQLREAQFFVIDPPPVRGLGRGGGFKMMVESRGGDDLDELQAVTWQLAGAANQNPKIARAFTTFDTGQPRYFLDIDRNRAEQLDVPLASLFETLQVQLGSAYVNDFNRFGRTYRVTAQAEAESRLEPEDLARLYTRSRTGDMVPLGSLVTLERSAGPDRVVRHNLYPTAELQGAAAPGVSSGEAIQVMAELARDTLPPGYAFEWTEIAYQEEAAGNAGLLIFPLSVLFVFLVLTAQYESWSLPLAVILIVPLCVVFALVGVGLAGMDNNILTQVGFVVLIGLACKNSILIVEFARQKEDEGLDRFEAAAEAARLRLRPILMTSLAFILGVVPLMIASGAGAEMRQNLGTAVFAGMLGVTLAGLFLTPAFYVGIRRFVRDDSGPEPESESESESDEPPPASAPAPAIALFLAVFLGSVGACTVGPTYQPPVPEAPDAFDFSIGAAAEPEAAWWARLDDPVLTDLVERARLANPDLAAAEASLAQARALLGLERWERLPSGSARAGAEYSETSAATLPDGFADQVDRDDVYYSAGLDAAWELDLFGRVRRSIEAQAARVEATEADRRAVFVAVAGEVGRTYMELRGTQLRLQVARDNVDNQAESLELVEALLDAGRGTQLDVSQARAQLETTRASVPRLEAAEARAIHRLSVLVGEPPGALRPLLEPSAALPPVPERIAVGDPASLLRRRPDVTAAERRLAASTADIGVAVADLFPRVTLSGSVGHLATSLGDLGSSDTRTLSFGPFLQWAAFDLGRVRDRIRATEAGEDLRLALYEKAVLTALEETENALVRLDRARESQARLQVAEAAAAEAAELARLRYRRGLDSFLVVLDAEARRLASQDALAQSAVETGAAFVALYEALGGGWDVTVDDPVS